MRVTRSERRPMESEPREGPDNCLLLLLLLGERGGGETRQRESGRLDGKRASRRRWK